MHWTLGFPEYPMGQVQLDSCRRDLQMAFDPHGSTWHASRHVPSTHFWGSGHSKSDRHDGRAVTENKHLLIIMTKRKTDIICIIVQCT